MRIRSFSDLYWSVWRGWRYHWGPGAVWRSIVRFTQRGLRGWSNEDTWSLDDYLTRVIIETLHHQMKHQSGYPSSLSASTHGDGLTEWKSIMLKMIYSFEARKKLCELDDSWWEYVDGKQTERSKEREAELVRVRDEGAALFMEWFNDLWT